MPFITIKCTIMPSPRACEEVCKCDKPKLGNPNSVEPSGARQHTYEQWVVRYRLTNFSAPFGYPPRDPGCVFLCCSEREQRRGVGDEDKNQIGANTMQGSVLPSQSPFIGMVECFVTE